MTHLDSERQLDLLERLHSITSRHDQLYSDKVQELLRLGCEAFDMPLAIVSHIQGDVYTIEHSYGRIEAPEPGTVFDLGKTYCLHTLAADGPTGFHHVAQSQICDHPCYETFGLESYIGAPVIVDGRRFGTVNFSSAEPREGPFSERDFAFVQLFAQWMGTEIFHVRAKSRLVRQKALFEALFRNAPDAMVLTDRHRRIKLINKAFTDMFGYAGAEMLGRTTERLYEDREAYLQAGELRFNPAVDEIGTPIEIRFRRKDGTVFDSDTLPSVIRDDESNVLCYLGQIRDITERKAIQRLKDELISTVSHELRTPLTSIKGGLGLIVGGAAGEIPEQARSLIDVAYENCKRLISLLNDILDVEKLASGHMELDIQSQWAADLVQASLTHNDQYARQHGVRFQQLESEVEARIAVDPDRFEQVMCNLLSNAAKFSPEGGTVEVRLTRDDEYVQISVRDHGPGVPPKFQKDLFERFTQADSSDTRKMGGTGLGLSIARSLVEAMGGSIAYSDHPEGGAVFAVTFPISEQAARVSDESKIAVTR